MNCERALHHIALDTGGDLPADQAQALSAHLSGCENCRRLAAEFGASREMLRAYEPPEFDAAFFDAVRHNVLREIRRAPAAVAPAPLFSRLFPRRRTLAYAAGFALLLLAAVSVLRIMDGARRGGPGPAEVVRSGDEGGLMPPAIPSVGIEPDNVPPEVATPTTLTTDENRPRVIAARTPRMGRGGAGRVKEPSANIVETAPDEAANVTTQSANGFESGTNPEAATVAPLEVADRKMLRIELQTSDPNVRIIWLSPQAAERTPRK